MICQNNVCVVDRKCAVFLQDLSTSQAVQIISLDNISLSYTLTQGKSYKRQVDPGVSILENIQLKTVDRRLLQVYCV